MWLSILCDLHGLKRFKYWHVYTSVANPVMLH